MAVARGEQKIRRQEETARSRSSWSTWLIPVASGLVASLAHPGGNVTGFSVLSPGIVQKALAILKELAPHVSRVGVLMDPTNPAQARLDESMDAGARALGITLRRADVGSSVKLVYPLPIAPPER